MPADPRLLLRAAVASSSAQGSNDGIKDRFASYHPKTRALRCTACDYLAIKHESLWASHAASKSHRANVAKIRSEEEEKKAREAAVNEVAMSEDLEVDAKKASNKRKGDNLMSTPTVSDEGAKRLRTNGEESMQDGAVDTEWDRFQREVLNASSSSHEPPPLSTYANATIEVAPVLKPGINGMDTDADEGESVEEEESFNRVETEAEKRIRLEREDREEIIARLEEEQRLQDEADERVNALKDRFERLKQARASKKK